MHQLSPKAENISIHALLAESDRNDYVRYCIHARGISIHALLAESDRGKVTNEYDRNDFYPRSPCGERLVHALKLANTMLFLSTLSLRRATEQAHYIVWENQISIHALLAESDVNKIPD